jgi:signal transduction histidine kinase
LIREVVDSFSSTVEGLGVVTAVDVENDIVELDIDPQRIHQVLANLVANAVNHLPDGGQVRVRAGQDEGTVVIEVSDTGPGIPEDQLERIFERFVRIGDSAGTGLGLSIARDLIEAHGGTLTATNRTEGGAVFTIRLPT